MNEEDPDFVREFARVRLAISQARRNALQSCGHTEQSFKKLECDALAQIFGTDEVDTEFGKVKVEKKNVYKHKDSIKIGETAKLTLIKNREN